MLDSSQRLHATLAAICPIDGVSIGTPGQLSTVVIHYDASSVPAQQAAAQAALAAFNWSDAAQQAWQLEQNQTTATPQLVATDPVTIAIRALGLQCLAVDNALAEAINTLIVAVQTCAAKCGATVTVPAALPHLAEAPAKAALASTITAGAANS